MNLYRRGRVWWIKYMAGGVVHRQSTGSRSRREAERWLNAIKTARNAPSFDDAVEILRVMYRQEASQRIAIADAYAEYERIAAAIGRTVGKTTARKRRICFEAFRKWLAKNAATVKTVNDVTGAVAAKYAEWLLQQGKKSKTRINIIGDLSTIWRTVEKTATGLQNPWEGLRPTNTDGKRLDAFTREDETKVLDAARKIGDGWFEVCVILRNTGFRYEDVALLKWDECDMERRIIRHKPIKTQRHNIEVVLPMVGEVHDALASLMSDGQDTPYVFPKHAFRYNKGYKGWGFTEVLKAAGLDGKNYTVHSWRHTAATRLAEAGASVEMRKAILGHTTDAMAEHYDHAERLAEKLAALERARV